MVPLVQGVDGVLEGHKVERLAVQVLRGRVSGAFKGLKCEHTFPYRSCPEYQPSRGTREAER